MIYSLRKEFNFCPKCGSARFKAGKNYRNYTCEVCSFQFYLNNSAAVACLIINTSGEILFARRAIEPGIGMLDLPGGFVEPLETAEEAVRREIQEELGVKVAQLNYLTSFPNIYPFSNFEVPTLDMAFLCELEKMDEIQPADDVASVEFIDPNALNLSDLCSDSMRNIILYYLKYLANEVS